MAFPSEDAIVAMEQAHRALERDYAAFKKTSQDVQAQLQDYRHAIDDGDFIAHIVIDKAILATRRIHEKAYESLAGLGDSIAKINHTLRSDMHYKGEIVGHADNYEVFNITDASPGEAYHVELPTLRALRIVSGPQHALIEREAGAGGEAAMDSVLNQIEGLPGPIVSVAEAFRAYCARERTLQQGVRQGAAWGRHVFQYLLSVENAVEFLQVLEKAERRCIVVAVYGEYGGGLSA